MNNQSINSYYNDLIDEIFDMLKSNVKIYSSFSDEYFVKLKEKCVNNTDEKYHSLPYNELLFYAEEVLSDLINIPFIYDFRSLE